MIIDGSKHCSFIVLIFITKSISKNLLIGKQIEQDLFVFLSFFMAENLNVAK